MIDSTPRRTMLCPALVSPARAGRLLCALCDEAPTGAWLLRMLVETGDASRVVVVCLDCAEKLNGQARS